MGETDPQPARRFVEVARGPGGYWRVTVTGNGGCLTGALVVLDGAAVVLWVTKLVNLARAGHLTAYPLLVAGGMLLVMTAAQIEVWRRLPSLRSSGRP